MNGTDDATRRYREKLAEAAKTIERLRAQLAGAPGPLAAPGSGGPAGTAVAEPVAVVGMALRMPGSAGTPEEFWRQLRGGVDATGEFPAARGDARSFFHPDPDNRGTAYVIRGGFLDAVDGFDPEVFGISPREAVGMDPQQRIVLELAWEALEGAGYAPTGLAGSRTGVYVGASTSDYVRMRQQLGRIEDVDGYQLIGEPSFIAGRVSYTLGLRGPSQVIDTTCSSALVAVHTACQALRQGECDLALSGGVNLMLSPYGFVLMSKFRALAPDGRCKTFDASADGYARGEGAGLVVLKRLTDAVAAGDTVLATIRGSAVNHDGRSSGLTVPSPEAQQDVIRRALAQAGVAPAEVGYVEAHGTGTSLGDPIELRALDAVMKEGRDPAQPLVVGSVKANIGHLEPAAGIAGLIKVIVSLQHGEIPPQLNMTTPNPKVPWRQLRIEVPTALIPWPGEPGRLAGVSSFGASGTNAHVIVGEAGQPAAGEAAARSAAPPGAAPGSTGARRGEVLVLSARTPTALRELSARYAEHLVATDQRLADICFTSQVGRARLAHGVAVTGDSRLDIAGQLARFSRGDGSARVTEAGLAPHNQRTAGWLFTGQGAQYAGMASGLRDDPAFAAAFAECQDLLAPILPRPLGEVLWGEAGSEIDDTRYAQPALFAVEYALGRTLLSWGLRPAMMLGHSVGEIAAACLAGAIDLPDAALLIGHRGRLMAGLPRDGTMIAVNCDEATAVAAIGDRDGKVSVAAVNGPSDIVLSGALGAVRAVAGELAAAGYRTHPLTVSHAFHSPLLRPVLPELGAIARSVTVRQPRIPLVSDVTGRPWGAGELDPEYWVAHAAGTVRFHEGLRHMRDEGVRTFLEIGPQPVLTGIGRRAIGDTDCAWIGTLRRGRDDRGQVLRALGTLHLRGSAVDWPAAHAGRPRRVQCPTYPWERQRFWFRSAMPGSAASASGAPEQAPGLGSRLRGPEPGFEQLTDEGPVTTAAQALGWLVERSVRGAVAARGGRWRRLAGATVDPAVVHEARGPWLVQTVLREAGDGEVSADSSGASPEAARSGVAWRPHGSVTLSRAARQAAEPPPVPRAGDAEPWLVPGQPAGDDGAAWGRIIEVAAAALTGVSGGWAHAFTEARCAMPGAVRQVRVVSRVSDGDESRADCLLCAEDGSVLGEIRELRCGPVPGPPPSRWEEGLLYRVTWTAAPGGDTVPGTGESRALMIAAVPGTARGAQGGPGGQAALAGEDERLAQELRARGIPCDLRYPAQGLTDREAGEEIDAWLDAFPTHVVISGLAVPDGDNLTAGDLTARTLPAEQTVVRVVARLAARDWPGAPPRVVLLTRGAVAVGTRQRRHSPAAATLWGLGRVIALEHPELWGGAVDLDPDGGGATAAATVAGVFAAAVEDGEDQWAARGHRRYVARLRPVPSHALPEPAIRRPHRPGTVLILGGLGGIGAVVADWLAATGTERIVLASRAGLPAEADWDDPGLDQGTRDRIGTVRRLREAGAEVEAVALDVTDEAAVHALTRRLAVGPFPLRGVVHAAGVSGPQDLVAADPEAYQRVWAAKALGAWLLHEATRDLDLDLFVCFSSIAATWGSQHLASYAAGNMFLDGLASYRRARGLPCLAVDWGPWGLASGLFGDDVMAFLESTGLRRLHPPQCLSLLGRLLRAGEPDYVVCAVDWNRYRPVMEARAARPVLHDIVIAEAEPSAQDRALLEALRAHCGAAPEDQAARAALLGTFLAGAVAAALGMEPGRVSADADVFALGLDSLMVMEVVSACRRGLGITLRPADFFSRSTLAGWASHLDQALRGGQAGGDDHPAADTAGTAAGRTAGTGLAVGSFDSPPAISPRARLAPDIRPPGPGLPEADPDVVLLTGATGYVGALLLDELLTATTARIACLTRCSGPGAGLDRIRRNLGRYRQWQAGAESRIEVLPGDLARPRLGLSDADYASVADRAGAIYHAGAWVDFVHTFEQVAPANIGGTEEILRLSVTGRPKMVANVSTYGIWGLPAEGRARILETADIRTAGRLVTGYVQTKWAAECLAVQAQERGMPVRNFRLGRVLGDSRTGTCLTTHFTCRVIKGCIQLGLAPDLDDLEIEMTPADYVARALVHISRSQLPGHAFHLVNPAKMRFNDLVRFMRRRGWQLRVVDREHWWDALRASMDAAPNELHTVMDIVREFVVGGEDAIHYDVTFAEKALAGSGISCPPLDERLLETYFDYFVRSGYLTRPHERHLVDSLPGGGGRQHSLGRCDE